MRIRLAGFFRFSFYVTLATFILLPALNNGSVAAISQDSLNSVRYGTPFYDPNAVICGGGDTSTLAGNDNEQKAFNYLVSRGLSAPQAAGVIGNFMIESGMDPSIEQGGGDGTTLTPGVGYGIAQWTTAGRQQGLLKLHNQESKPINDLGLQLDYVWYEFSNGYAGMLKQLKGTNSVDQAAVIVMVSYEAPLDHDPNGPNAHAREKAAENALKLYGGTSQGGGSGSATSSSCLGGGTGQCNSTPPSSYDAIKNALLSQFKINITGDTNTDWAAQTYTTICKLAAAPAYFSRLTSQGPITVSLQSGECAGHSSSATGVIIYGVCGSNDYNRFVLTHELGHMFAFRNPAVYQAFNDRVWSTGETLPTFNCLHDYDKNGLRGPYEPECWADMIGEYLVWFDIRDTVGGVPPGPRDFNIYPTAYSAYYDFARDNLFGGVKYTSF